MRGLTAALLVLVLIEASMGQCVPASAAACPALNCTSLSSCATFSCTDSLGSTTCEGSPNSTMCASCCSCSAAPATTSAAATSASTTAIPAGGSNATSAPLPPSPPTTIGGVNATTGAPLSQFAMCDGAPAASVNMIFTALSQQAADLAVLRSSIADSCGIVVGRVIISATHGQYGTPYGNNTMLSISIISSSQLGECNVSNFAAAAILVLDCNSDPKPPDMSKLSLRNCTMVPLGAKVHVFPTLSTTDQIYIVIYVGVAVLYASFSVWVAQKFVLAFQLEVIERSKQEKEAEAEAARLGLPSPKAAAKGSSKAAKGGRGRGNAGGRARGGGKAARGGRGRGDVDVDEPSGPILALPNKEGATEEVDEETQAIMFSRSDVDEYSKATMQAVVKTMEYRLSADFARKEQDRYDTMNREMVPVVNPSLLRELESITMPPVSSASSRGLGIGYDQSGFSGLGLGSGGSSPHAARMMRGPSMNWRDRLDDSVMPQLPPGGAGNSPPRHDLSRLV